MSDDKKIRIEFTDEQKEELKKLTGKDAAGLELTAEELEERIAPYLFGSNVG